MLAGQPAAVVLLIDIGTVGDTDQRIVRLIHIRFGEIHVICGNQRNIHGIGHFHKPTF